MTKTKNQKAPEPKRSFAQRNVITGLPKALVALLLKSSARLDPRGPDFDDPGRGLHKLFVRDAGLPLGEDSTAAHGKRGAAAAVTPPRCCSAWTRKSQCIVKQKEIQKDVLRPWEKRYAVAWTTTIGQFATPSPLLLTPSAGRRRGRPAAPARGPA